MEKLLILCTGNTCRSPMAGVLALDWLKKHNEQEVAVKTAGLATFPGSPAASQGIQVMEELGLDLTEHQTNPVTSELIDWADLVLTMTWEHKRKVLSAYPEAEGKVFTLREYGEPVPEVERMTALAAIIAQKEQDFLALHQEELDKLLWRRQELQSELQAIEKEIATWQERIAEEVSQERQELWLLEQGLGQLDIRDPFGGTVEDYRETAQEIAKALETVLPRFQKERE